MPPDRTFDYDVLNQLIRDHPEASNRQYAEWMTNYERQVREDPSYPAILPNTIARAISMYRKRWADEGRPVKDRQFGRLIPWPNIPQAYIMDTRLRHLKTLEKMNLGQPVTDRQERQARAFRRRLQQQRRVVDITDTGRPFDRPALPNELDADGNLLKLTADVRDDWLKKSGEVDDDYLRNLSIRKIATGLCVLGLLTRYRLWYL